MSSLDPTSAVKKSTSQRRNHQKRRQAKLLKQSVDAINEQAHLALLSEAKLKVELNAASLRAETFAKNAEVAEVSKKHVQRDLSAVSSQVVNQHKLIATQAQTIKSQRKKIASQKQIIESLQLRVQQLERLEQSVSLERASTFVSNPINQP